MGNRNRGRYAQQGGRQENRWGRPYETEREHEGQFGDWTPTGISRGHGDSDQERYSQEYQRGQYRPQIFRGDQYYPQPFRGQQYPHDRFEGSQQFDDDDYESGSDRRSDYYAETRGLDRGRFQQGGAGYGRTGYGRTSYGRTGMQNRESQRRLAALPYGRERDYESRGEERGWWDRASDEVSSWFGDDEAERRRMMDHARDESHRGRGPKGYKRSDERIKEDVNDRLTDNIMLDASDIEVGVNDGDVVLSGTVNSRYAKRLAEDVVEEVSGVKNVENRIRVSQPNREYMGTGGSTERTSPQRSKSTTTGS